jgi:biotin operon repressor
VSGWQGRGALVTRQWQLLVLLRGGPKTLLQLADALAVSTRTIMRDLTALQNVPFPITSDREHGPVHARWSLASIPEWPRNEAVPVRTLPGGLPAPRHGRPHDRIEGRV